MSLQEDALRALIKDWRATIKCTEQMVGKTSWSDATTFCADEVEAILNKTHVMCLVVGKNTQCLDPQGHEGLHDWERLQ